jgi:localization factor PodJL
VQEIDDLAAGTVNPGASGAADRPDARIGPAALIDAAVDGDPAAAFTVAGRYAEGLRVPKDIGAAARWYERAADGGVAVAQYRLGSLYEHGQGVAKDLTKAVNWYQRAADQGNVNAMHNLAVLMSEGVDTTPDHAKALQWFRAAGDYGVTDSQYNLGVIYARGLGPQQDLIESYKWFAIAASQGDQDAATRRDEVGELLSADDLAKARTTVQAWRVRSPIAEANAAPAAERGWDDAIVPEAAVAELDPATLVARTQILLAAQGYDPGPADGFVGPKTRQAVLAFQRDAGEPATGEIDDHLVGLLDRAQN